MSLPVLPPLPEPIVVGFDSLDNSILGFDDTGMRRYAKAAQIECLEELLDKLRDNGEAAMALREMLGR